MPTVADSIKAIKRYVVLATPHKYPGLLCIVGPGTNAVRWYHAGEAEITGPKGLGLWDHPTNPKDDHGDPSTRRRRDRAGLSNAGSALDFSFRDATSRRYTKAAQRAQIEFTAHLVAGGKAGTVDIVEVLGPNADLVASFWGKPTWRRYKAGNTHRHHTHVSIPRDTEFADRVALLRLVDFFDGWQPPVGTPEPPDDDPPLPAPTPTQPPVVEEPVDPTYAELLADNEELEQRLTTKDQHIREALDA